MQRCLETVVDSVERLKALPLPQGVQGLCQLVADTGAAATGPVPVLLQGCLSEMLLNTLKPPTTSAAVLSHNTPTQPSCRTPSSPISTQPQPITGGADAIAAAWEGASQALELIYTWEDEEVVLSVIHFWSKVSSLMCGCWLQQDEVAPQPSLDPGSPVTTTQQQQCVTSEGPNSATPDPAATAALPQPVHHLELQYLSWLWGLGPTAVAAVVQQLHQFWHMTGVNHIQHLHQQPGSSTPGHLAHLLLLFLELQSEQAIHPSRSHQSSMSPVPAVQQLLHLLFNMTSQGPASIHSALTASEAFSVVCCLLQAAAVLQPSLPYIQHAAAAADTLNTATLEGAAEEADVAAPRALEVWPLLAGRAGSMLRHGYGWCSFGEAANLSAAAAAVAADAARLATAEARAHSSSSRGTAVERPSNLESLYDCFMTQLAQCMLAGPQHINSSIDSSGFEGRTLAAADAQQQQQQACGTAGGQAACRSSAGGQWSDEDWEEWISSPACGALAALVATYDRPGALLRALHILTQQQLTSEDNTTSVGAAATAAAAAAAAGQPDAGSSSQHSKAAAKKAAKSAMGRVLYLIDRVFLWRQHQQQQGHTHPAWHDEASRSGQGSSSTAALEAVGVRQLLLGLSELLRPAANCSVEWRCAALSSMLSAVEDFMHSQQGDAGLELHLWCDASVEGLLFCSNHDPSIQARRAAVQLLQYVVLPHGSSTARALVCCLANKLSDKDSGVAAAALELFVQLEPQVLGNCLTATQWCTAVQAALDLVTGAVASVTSGGSRAQSSNKGLVTAAVREQFMQQLSKVLKASPHAQLQGNLQWLGRTGMAGVDGCKQLLLLLMVQPLLAEKWQALQESF